MSEASTFADPLTERLVAFVRGIGIEVRAAVLPEKTFLPGLDIRHGAILVDAERLAHRPQPPGAVRPGHIGGTPLMDRLRRLIMAAALSSGQYRPDSVVDTSPGFLKVGKGTKTALNTYTLNFPGTTDIGPVA